MTHGLAWEISLVLIEILHQDCVFIMHFCLLDYSTKRSLPTTYWLDFLRCNILGIAKIWQFAVFYLPQSWKGRRNDRWCLSWLVTIFHSFKSIYKILAYLLRHLTWVAEHFILFLPLLSLFLTQKRCCQQKMSSGQVFLSHNVSELGQ